MNREEAKNLLLIIEHFANGGDVQYKGTGSNFWANTTNPTFSTRGISEWRIKPEPFECWVIVWSDGDHSDKNYESPEAAKHEIDTDSFNGEIIHMREVL